MTGKQAFLVLGLVGLAVAIYQRFVNPGCSWCGAALSAVTAGQKIVCPRCGRLN